MTFDVSAKPRGWPEPSRAQLIDARTFAATALADNGTWPVTNRLAAYYELAGNYAGSTFTHLKDVHPSSVNPLRVTVADLHAVSLLSVRVPPAATRALIDNVGGHATKVNAALGKLAETGVRHLRDADAEVLEAMDEVAAALTSACQRRGTKTVSNPWVLVSKLAARMAPDLFPVRDNVVCTALGLIGRGKPVGDRKIDWQIYRALLLDDDTRAAIIAAQDAVKALDRTLYGHEQDELRVLDAALWTYEIWRIAAEKKAGAKKNAGAAAAGRQAN